MKAAVVTRKSYCVELTVDEYKRVEAMDKDHEDRFYAAIRAEDRRRKRNGERPTPLPSPKPATKHESLMDRLMRLGAIDVEYDGHFGPNIYYTLRTDDDTPALQKKIHIAIANWADVMQDVPVGPVEQSQKQKAKKPLDILSRARKLAKASNNEIGDVEADFLLKKYHDHGIDHRLGRNSAAEGIASKLVRDGVLVLRSGSTPHPHYVLADEP